MRERWGSIHKPTHVIKLYRDRSIKYIHILYHLPVKNRNTGKFLKIVSEAPYN